MIKLKNYNDIIKQIAFLILFLSIISCGGQKNYLTKIEGQKLTIKENQSPAAEIEAFIKPYRDHVDADLNTVLAYNPETLDKKDGKWQTNIGNLMADICFKKGNLMFNKRENKSIDLCLLNHGGIRSILPLGNLTTRNAYHVMPFENSLFVAALKGTQILEMATYIIGEKKPHPLSGMSFTIGADKLPKNIMIQGQPLDNEKIYFVATNDYLINGGDNMDFFKTNSGTYNMDYKLRNILIDYLQEVDSVAVDKSVRISEE